MRSDRAHVRCGSNSDLGPRPSQVRSTLNSGNRQTARACPYRIVILGRAISNLVCHQQAQRCIVSNALLAKEGHCIDLGTGIVVGAKEPDVLDLGRHRSRGRGMFLTSHLTLPVSGGALIASCVSLISMLWCANFFPPPGRSVRLPENVRSTLCTLSAFKDVADRLRVPLPAGAVATTPGIQPLTIR